MSKVKINAYFDSIAYQVQILAPERASKTRIGYNRDIQTNEKIQFDLNRVGDIKNLANRIATEYEHAEDALRVIDRVIFQYGLDSSVSIFEALQRIDVGTHGSKKNNRELDLRKVELRLREIFSGDFDLGISAESNQRIPKQGAHPAEMSDRRYHGSFYERGEQEQWH